jgi:hypothetical protein
VHNDPLLALGFDHPLLLASILISQDFFDPPDDLWGDGFVQI